MRYSFQNSHRGEKHKSVRWAKGLIVSVTKLNILCASCDSLCNWKMLKDPPSLQSLHSMQFSQRKVSSFQKKRWVIVRIHLPLLKKGLSFSKVPSPFRSVHALPDLIWHTSYWKYESILSIEQKLFSNFTCLFSGTFKKRKLFYRIFAQLL